MRDMRFSVVGALAVSSLILSTASIHAAPIVLDFEGLLDSEQILDFYNGGTGSQGSSGPDYGIQFGSSALALIDSDSGGIGNFANEPSSRTIAFSPGAASLVLNVAAGFDTGFSFYYSSLGAATVSLFDGLNAGGNLLGAIGLVGNYNNGDCVGDPTGAFCHWDSVGVSFFGTARSIRFAAAADSIGIDDIVLNVATNGGQIPEPATLGLLGSGLAATFHRRIRRRMRS